MNLKTLVTTALLVAGTSSAALAGPRVIGERGHGPRVVETARPILVERGPARPILVERGPARPILVEHARPVFAHRVVRPIFRPLVRPIVFGAYIGAPCGEGMTTIGAFDLAFDGSQTIDLGAGRPIGALRVAADANTTIYSLTVTYADGATQQIPCDRIGSFETDLGGNLVTQLTITADHPSASPLQVQAA